MLGSMENCLLFVSFSSPLCALKRKDGWRRKEGKFGRYVGGTESLTNGLTLTCPIEHCRSPATLSLRTNQVILHHPHPRLSPYPPKHPTTYPQSNAYPQILKPQPHPPSAPSSSQFPTRQPHSPDPCPATASAPPPVRSCPQSK